MLYDTSGLGPVAVSWWRFVGGVTLLALARRWFGGPGLHGGRRRTLRLMRRSWRPVVVTGCGLAIYQTAYYVAIDLTGLAVATVVTLGAGPILIAVGGRLAGLERPDGAGLAAAGVALVGLALLVGADAGVDGGTGLARLAGVGFALLSATGYAAVTLLTRRGNGLSRYDTALGGFAVGAVVLAPLAVVAGPLPHLGGSLPLLGTLGLLLYLVVVPTALAYALFFAGLAVVRATTASVVILVEPVTAAVVAVTLLGERLSPVAAGGGAVLLGAVVLMVCVERRAPTRVRS
jgi:DME family drug/metabolite transporter